MRWKGQPMYALDLTTLLLALQESRYTGQLQAHVPIGIPELSNGRAMMTVVRGHVKACVLFNMHGQQLVSGEQAFALVGTMGPLEWQRTQTPLLNGWTGTSPQEQSPEQWRTRPHQPVRTPPAYPQSRLPESRALPQPNSDPEWLRGTTPDEFPRVTTPLPSITMPLPRVSGSWPHVTQPSQKIPARPKVPTSPPTQPINPILASIIPQRRVTINQQTLASLPRLLRRVLVLVDGARSIGKITELLYANPARFSEVLEAIKELERMGIVTFSR